MKISSTNPLGLEHLRGAPGVTAFELVDGTATATLDRADRTPELVALLAGRQIPITSVVPFVPSLEDLYFAVRRDSGSTGDEIAPPEESSGRPIRDHLPAAA